MSRLVNKKSGAFICGVALVVGMLAGKIEQGTAKYPLRISAEAMEHLIGKWEGCRQKGYLDGGNIPTVGIGSTNATCGEVDMNKIYTIEEIADRFNKDLYVAEQCVNRMFNGAYLKQGEFEALTSFTFNVGCSKATRNKNGGMTNFRRAFLTNDPKRCERFMDWTWGRNSKGELVQWKGLKNRRNQEKEWCKRDD